MQQNKKVLIVEDSEHLNRINRRAFELAGYSVATALTLKEARAQLARMSPDAIVLDVLLPDGSGLDFCREIRQDLAAPILFLTSVSGYEQALEGLRAGGDDYLGKPYDINMLVAKIDAFLRRDDIAGRVRAQQTLRHGPLELDQVARQASVNGKDLGLAPKEFALLMLFVNNEGKVMPREALYEAVWKRPMGDDATALKNAVYRLRQKLGGSGFWIETLWGSGYRFEPEA